MSIIILTNHTPIKYENQYILSKIYITYGYKSVTNQKAENYLIFINSTA